MERGTGRKWLQGEGETERVKPLSSRYLGTEGEKRCLHFDKKVVVVEQQEGWLV